MDIARQILLEIEKNPKLDSWVDMKALPYDEDVIYYHIKLLKQAGLIEAINIKDSMKNGWAAKSLTWHGHEFLDAARNNSNWERAKKYIKTKGGSLTFETIKLTLSLLLKKQLEIF